MKIEDYCKLCIAEKYNLRDADATICTSSFLCRLGDICKSSETTPEIEEAIRSAYGVRFASEE